jgi:hypothetical protein
MDQQELPSLRWTIPIGVIIAAAGLYFVLVSIGMAPPPDGYEAVQTPGWIIFCAGLVFAFAGVTVALRGTVGALRSDGDLSLNAPRWLRLTQYAAGLTIFACFGAVATWIAFGPGPRTFSASGPLLPSHPSEMVGRTVFGIGAALTWLGMIVIAISGARKLFDHGKS